VTRHRLAAEERVAALEGELKDLRSAPSASSGGHVGSDAATAKQITANKRVEELENSVILLENDLSLQKRLQEDMDVVNAARQHSLEQLTRKLHRWQRRAEEAEAAQEGTQSQLAGCVGRAGLLLARLREQHEPPMSPLATATKDRKKGRNADSASHSHDGGGSSPPVSPLRPSLHQASTATVPGDASVSELLLSLERRLLKLGQAVSSVCSDVSMLRNRCTRLTREVATGRKDRDVLAVKLRDATNLSARQQEICKVKPGVCMCVCRGYRRCYVFCVTPPRFCVCASR